MVSGPVLVRRSTVRASSLVGMVLNGGTLAVAMFSGEAARLETSWVALSPDLMLVVTMTSVLPSQWARLAPIQPSTFLGQAGASLMGITRVPIISRLITM